MATPGKIKRKKVTISEESIELMLQDVNSDLITLRAIASRNIDNLERHMSRIIKGKGETEVTFAMNAIYPLIKEQQKEYKEVASLRLGVAKTLKDVVYTKKKVESKKTSQEISTSEVLTEEEIKEISKTLENYQVNTSVKNK